MADDRGLNPDGTIAREGALVRVAAPFEPVVRAVRERVASAGLGLDGAYLYGSIPRGSAVVGVSDLDVLLALPAEPTEADRAAARAMERALDAEFPQVNGAGIQLASTANLLSERERFDGGFFVACLCTPLSGEDLAERLPAYRPTALLARQTNGDLGRFLPTWRARLAGGGDADRLALSRGVGRKLVRTGFTLIMPRWGGWTSDLTRSADLFGRYYPDRARQMLVAAEVGRSRTADAAVLAELIDNLGQWLAAEYETVHGRKTTRP